jgi:hypothetical protein
MTIDRETAARVINDATKHYYMSIEIPKDMLESHRLTPAYMIANLNIVVMQLLAMVRGRTINEISHPVDWWQAFRERWLPKWWLAKYPVIMRRYQLDHHYPPEKPDGILRVYRDDDRGYLR